MSKIKIVSVNISEKKGEIKLPVDEIVLNEHGIEKDAHAGSWHRQVSMLAKESIDKFTKMEVRPGEFAENITTVGLDYSGISILDRFVIGESELEVTQIGKKCHGDGCAIFQEVGECVMPKEGIFCRVIKGGTVKKDDEVEYIPRNLNFKIITLSDRAKSGEYDDLSGPKIKSLIDDFFKDRRWHQNISNVIISDDELELMRELNKAKDEQVDVVITTGGTGIGPRDITPEVVEKFSEKLIPGVMDYIRIKYGETIPNALLSRSVAGVSDKTLVYALPGSVKAVTEYTHEILKTMEHLITMLHGIGH